MTYTDTVDGVLKASNHSIISSVFKDEILFVTTTFKKNFISIFYQCSECNHIFSTCYDLPREFHQGKLFPASLKAGRHR